MTQQGHEPAHARGRFPTVPTHFDATICYCAQDTCAGIQSACARLSEARALGGGAGTRPKKLRIASLHPRTHCHSLGDDGADGLDLEQRGSTAAAAVHAPAGDAYRRGQCRSRDSNSGGRRVEDPRLRSQRRH